MVHLKFTQSGGGGVDYITRFSSSIYNSDDNTSDLCIYISVLSYNAFGIMLGVRNDVLFTAFPDSAQC